MGLMTDPARVISQLREFEIDAILVSRQKRISLEQARQYILSASETRHGFTELISIAHNVSTRHIVSMGLE